MMYTKEQMEYLLSEQDRLMREADNTKGFAMMGIVSELVAVRHHIKVHNVAVKHANLVAKIKRDLENAKTGN